MSLCEKHDLKHLLTIAFIALMSFGSKAQYIWDFGAKLGAANYLGDIGGGEGPAQDFVYDLKIEATRISGGAYGRYFMGNSVAASIHLTQAMISGADENSTNPERYSRNLSFRNGLVELTPRLEWHIIKIHDVGRTFRYRLNFNFFLYGGAGVVWSNPKAKLNDQWVALQPLQTEGVKYGRFQFTAPVGIGAFFRHNKRHVIGAEFGWRWTMTDYLDDIRGFYQNPDDFEDPIARTLADRSVEMDPNDPLFIGSNFYGEGSKANPAVPAKRGNPENNDSYFVAGFTYGYALRGKTSFSRSRYNFIKGKPRKRRSKAKF